MLPATRPPMLPATRPPSTMSNLEPNKKCPKHSYGNNWPIKDVTKDCKCEWGYKMDDSGVCKPSAPKKCPKHSYENNWPIKDVTKDCKCKWGYKMDDSGICNLEATHDCNQGGIYTAKIATHPDHRCNTKCADAAGEEIAKCLKPNEYIATLTGLMDKNLSSIQKCVGSITLGSTTPVVTLVTGEEDFERRITDIANQGQKVLDSGCGGGGIAAVFI